MGKCQTAPPTLTPSHLSGEAASMVKSFAKRAKRHRSCQVTPSFNPSRSPGEAHSPCCYCPPFLGQKTWRQIKPETWEQVFCSWKASRTHLNRQIKPETWRQFFYSYKASRTLLNTPPSPSPPTPRCNLTTTPTLAAKDRTNSRHFGHQDLNPGQHDFLRYLIVQHPDLFRRIENHSLALLPKTELTKITQPGRRVGEEL